MLLLRRRQSRLPCPATRNPSQPNRLSGNELHRLFDVGVHQLTAEHLASVRPHRHDEIHADMVDSDKLPSRPSTASPLAGKPWRCASARIGMLSAAMCSATNKTSEWTTYPQR